MQGTLLLSQCLFPEVYVNAGAGDGGLGGGGGGGRCNGAMD